MLQRFSTRGMKKADRFSYFREAACETYLLLGLESEVAEEFHGGIVLERLPGISVSTVFSDTCVVNRRKKDIARSRDNCFLLSLQLKNKGYVNQHNRTAELHPGDFAIYRVPTPINYFVLVHTSSWCFNFRNPTFWQDYLIVTF